MLRDRRIMRKILTFAVLWAGLSVLMFGIVRATPISGSNTSNVFVDTFNNWAKDATGTDSTVNWVPVACATCPKGSTGTGTINKNLNGDVAPFDNVNPGYAKLKDTANQGFWTAAPDVFANSVNPVDLSHFD